MALPITSERVAKLREFGLSEYASRTYLALLDLGTAEARDISGVSKVPASKVYRILEQLHEKGLVAILPEFPRKYAPVPFAEYLDKIHEEHEAAAAAIESERDALAEMFAVMGDVEASDRGTFTIVRGRRNVLDKIREVSSLSATTLAILATPGLVQRPAVLNELVAAATAQGLAVRLIVPAAGSEIAGLPAIPVPGELRLLAAGDAPDGGAVILGDRSRAVLVHFLPDDGHGFEGNDTAMATDHVGMAAIIAGLFDAAWARARAPTAREIPVAPERTSPSPIPER